MIWGFALVVTGSRDWEDHDPIEERLFCRAAGLPREEPRILIHGAHSSGADAIATYLGRMNDWTVIAMPAQWRELGNPAGPVRNQHMADVLDRLKCCGYRVAAEAFPLPSSKGTWDCVRRLKNVTSDVHVWKETVDE